MHIKSLPLGYVSANCYILNDGNGIGAVIDPGDFNDSLLSAIEESKISELKYIICTHGHFDHINGVSRLKKKYPQAKVLIGADDAPMLTSCELSAAVTFGLPFYESYADMLLKNGDKINIGNIQLTVYSTPGHSQGGIILYCEKERVAFTGDTVFRGSVGRSDLYGGNHGELMSSIKIIKRFPPETVLYCGHGESTTVAYECMYNFYLL